DRVEVGVPGGVEDAVDAPELRVRGLDGRFDRVLVGDIAAHAEAAELRGDLLRLLLVEVDDRDLAALGGELPRGRRREPRAAAGREQHLAVEAHGCSYHTPDR